MPIQNQPVASVVIPAFNAAGTISDTLGALSRQDFGGDFEVIIADNGSTDNLQVVANSFVGVIPGLQIVDASRRRGPAFARNAGAAEARGLILAFCDADDVPDSAWLRSLVNESRGVFAVGGRLEYVRLNGNMPSAPLAQMQASALPVPMAHLPFSSTANLLVPADAFDSVGGFDGRLITGEDVDFCWRLQSSGYKLNFCSDAIVHYRLRDSHALELGKLFRYAQGDALIYKLHSRNGARRRSLLGVLRSWLTLIVSAPLCILASRRDQWLRSFVKHLGWLFGSIRHRVIYL